MRSRSSLLPPVLLPIDLPAPELRAAALDGELFGIGGAFCPIDEFVAPAHRARVVLGGRAPRLIAELGTAAWIWGAVDDAPRIPECCVRLRERARPVIGSGVDVREVVIEDEEIVDLGGVRVTAPLRTAVDLARFRPSFGSAEHAIVARLARIGEFGPDEALSAVERRRNLHGKRRAANRLSSRAIPWPGGAAVSSR